MIDWSSIKFDIRDSDKKLTHDFDFGLYGSNIKLYNEWISTGTLTSSEMNHCNTELYIP
jgi:hypothetical protein